MTKRSNVVPETSGVTEVQFHAAMCAGLARAEKTIGSDRALAFVMDLKTTKQLENIHKGGDTAPKRLWDALSADDSALDDIAALYGVKVVDQDAVCNSDDASVLIAKIMLWLQEAKHPDSPGGSTIVHTELLPAEFLIRQLHRATGDWIEAIKSVREAA